MELFFKFNFFFVFFSTMARMKICGAQLAIGDDDLGLVMIFHICFRILNVVCLILSLVTYTSGNEEQIPQYLLVSACSLDFRLKRL